MDMEYSTIRWSDKPYTTYGTSGPRARDGVAMAAIVHGGREAIESEPALMGVVNPNSPLIWDFRMTDALMVWAEANQPIIVTPGEEAWRVKEAKVGTDVPEAWGDWEERAIQWETLTAAALVESGADVLVMRHPEAVKRIKKMIGELMNQ